VYTFFFALHLLSYFFPHHLSPSHWCQTSPLGKTCGLLFCQIANISNLSALLFGSHSH
jgi:hypothetical protein